MTCIIGLKHEGKIYMGCDSASVGDWDQRQSLIPKVFIRDNFIVGYTTSFRMGQLLQYDLELPTYIKQIGKGNPLKFMVCDFIPAVRDILKSGGFTEIDDNRETGGQFLVGFKGELFFVDNDFQVNQFADEFDAIGIGYPFALGAMKALESMNDPARRILWSLEIVGRFAKSVAGPYHVEVLE